MRKSDEKLLNDLRSTSLKKMRKAFSCLYEKYSPLIYYLSIKELAHKEDAEDIVSQTFLKFFENKNEVKSGHGVKYYLVTITKNLITDLKRRKAKEVPLEDDIPSSNIEYDEHIEIFKKFLDEEEIEYMVLHLLYGFTFKEIASEKNLSVDAISSKYYRAIQKAKKYYGKESKDV